MPPLTRRRFVSSAAGLAGAAAVGHRSRLTARSQANVVGANERVRVAVIGCGGMGRAHIANFQQLAETQIVAVCDVWGTNLSRAVRLTERQTHGPAKPVKDFRHVLDMKDVDVAVVATPDHWHALPMVMACQAGKDVYVEKPCSVTITEGRKMVDAARKHGRVVQVGTQQRSGAHYQEAVSLIKQGRLGKVHRIDAWNHGNSAPFGVGTPVDSAPPADLDWDLWLGPAPRVPFNGTRFLGSFRWFWDYAGGQMTDWGVHHLDIVNWALDAIGPVSVTTVGARFNPDNGETPDTIEALYVYAGCIVRYSHRSTNAHVPNGRSYGILFYGTEGTMFLDRSGYEVVAEVEGPREPPPPGYVRDQRAASTPPAPPWTRPHRARQERFPTIRGDGSEQNVSHIRNFYDCIKSRKPPISDIEAGHRSSSTAMLGNIAYRTGRHIVWDADREAIVGDPDAGRLLSRDYRAPWKL